MGLSQFGNYSQYIFNVGTKILTGTSTCRYLSMYCSGSGFLTTNSKPNIASGKCFSKEKAHPPEAGIVMVCITFNNNYNENIMTEITSVKKFPACSWMLEVSKEQLTAWKKSGTK